MTADDGNTEESAGAADVAGSGRPGRRGPRVRRRVPGRPVVIAASALGAAGAVLASTLVATGGSGEAASSHGAAAEGRQARPAAPAAPAGPEKCDDGEYPAASLRPKGGDGAAVERIKERGELVVGVDQNSFQWGFRNPGTGRLEGFDIDLARAIGKDLLGAGGKVTFKSIPTDQRFPALQRRDVDMVVRTVTIRCGARNASSETASPDEDKVDFSGAYFQTGQQLLVQSKKREEIKGFKSLRGKKVCFAAGSTAEDLMKGRFKDSGARHVVVPNQLDCLVRLQLGEADATVTDGALGASHVKQDPSVALVGEPETEEKYGVAMNAKDEDLVRRVNKVLEKFGKDEWRESYDDWLKKGLSGTKGDGDSAKPPELEYRD